MNKKSFYFICLFIFLELQLLPWGAATHKTLVDQSVFKSIPLGSASEAWLKKFNLDRGFFYKYFNFNNERYDLMQMIAKGAEFSRDSGCRCEKNLSRGGMSATYAEYLVYIF